MAISNTSQFQPEGNANIETNSGGVDLTGKVDFYYDYDIGSSDSYYFETIQKNDLGEVCKYLAVSVDALPKISYKVYENVDKKRAADPNHSGSRASARCDEMTIYRVWSPSDGENPSFPHEIVHLVAHLWSVPYRWNATLTAPDGSEYQKEIGMISTSFMQEGLAIAVDDIVFGRKLKEEGQFKLIDDWCREQIDSIKKIDLASVINFDGFCSMDNKLVVPFSASLSKFLLNKYGLDKYKQMYIGVKEIMSPEQNIEMFESVYGSYRDLVAGWLKSI